jgi:hypothetical protein
MNNAQTHNQSVNPQQKGTHTLFAMFGLAVLTVAIAMLLDSPAQPQAWIALIIAVMTGSIFCFRVVSGNRQVLRLLVLAGSLFLGTFSSQATAISCDAGESPVKWKQHGHAGR